MNSSHKHSTADMAGSSVLGLYIACYVLSTMPDVALAQISTYSKSKRATLRQMGVSDLLANPVASAIYMTCTLEEHSLLATYL